MKAISGRIRKILREKASKHNASSASIKLQYFRKVFNRGVVHIEQPGSVRGNVRSADQWALARVNGFLYALRNGRFKRNHMYRLTSIRTS